MSSAIWHERTRPQGPSCRCTFQTLNRWPPAMMVVLSAPLFINESGRCAVLKCITLASAMGYLESVSSPFWPKKLPFRRAEAAHQVRFESVTGCERSSKHRRVQTSWSRTTSEPSCGNSQAILRNRLLDALLTQEGKPHTLNVDTVRRVGLARSKSSACVPPGCIRTVGGGPLTHPEAISEQRPTHTSHPSPEAASP